MASSFQKIASTVALMERGKSQATIGDIREILKCLVIIEAASRVEKTLKSKTDFTLEGGIVSDLLDRKASVIAQREIRKARKKKP